MFVDEATVSVKAGKGGDGLSSFRRERYVDRGGPDGGDGGDGGDITVRADHNANTLIQLRRSRLVKAEDGERGKKQRGSGKRGTDVELVVPPGTVVQADGESVADLARHNQTAVVAHGGHGGFGNAHFVSSRRQAPDFAELGEAGEEKNLHFELKTVADIGLVGLPNVGKSTLLSVITAARPEIADYPFTTLSPNLGVAEVFDTSLVVADIPGLIAGASRGKGLGDRFLRHIERTKVLIHLIDVKSADVRTDYDVVRAELGAYSLALSEKPELVVLAQIDTVSAKAVRTKKAELQNHIDREVLTISAPAHQGLSELLGAALAAVRELPEPASALEELPVLTLADDPKAWWIEETGGRFLVQGEQISGFARRSDFKNREAIARLRVILQKLGIRRELERRGLKAGDSIVIAGKKLIW